MEKVKIISTIGPKSLNQKTIQKMDSSGVDEFRINLSHTSINAYEEVVNKLASWTNKPVYTDIEGGQLRTGSIPNKTVSLETNTSIKLSFSENPVDNSIPLYPNIGTDIFNVGDILFIDFDSACIQITEVKDTELLGRVLSGGMIGSNKGIGIDRIIEMPYITEKDKSILEISAKLKQAHFCLSFASSGEDVKNFRKLFTYPVKITSKIENRDGLNNLRSICHESDEILIDRGDLSRDIDLPAITIAQKQIIEVAKELQVPVNVATNLLETMIDSQSPTRAEISDITNALLDGATGLVLAAETAIGNNPIKSVRVIKRVIDQVEISNQHTDLMTKDRNADGLIKPHGGLLNISYYDHDNSEFSDMLKIPITKMDISDCIQIAEGTYSPNKGFHSLDEVYSILESNKLLSGISWPLPLILQTDSSTKKQMEGGKEVLLVDLEDDTPIAVLADYDFDKIDNTEAIAESWFGTKDKSHPGVRRLTNGGEYLIHGTIKLASKPKKYIKSYELTPYQTRSFFSHNMWQEVVGFHTRNIPHRGHEYIQKDALEITGADALFISPLIGSEKSGDFSSDAIIEAYNILITNNIYYPNPVVVGGLNTYPRFAGPREAVFTAICRKNFGCSHFIVGRDHSGIGEFYKGVSIDEYFEKFDDLGLNIVYFDEVAYSTKNNNYFQVTDNKFLDNDIKMLSGTSVRSYINGNRYPPNYLIRPEVVDVIKAMGNVIIE